MENTTCHGQRAQAQSRAVRNQDKAKRKRSRLERIKRALAECAQRLAFSPFEFGHVLGRSETWAYRRVYDGTVKAISDSGRLLIPRSELDRFLARACQYNRDRYADTDVAKGGIAITSSESYIFLAVLAALALVALIYLLSPMSLLEDITIRGAEIRTRLRELLARHTYTTDTRTVLVIGAADQALEHHEAIWRLRESELNGSALAMIRLVWDAMFRALWLRAVATDEQVEQASRDELSFRMDKVRDDIKRVYFGTPEDPKKAAELDMVFGEFKMVWKRLSSYTHSGALQLARRFTFDQVKPSYADHELAHALSAATEALLFCFVLLFKSIDAHEEADETVTTRQRYDVIPPLPPVGFPVRKRN